MSMYLPNPDVGPIGVEPGEFIDFPVTAAELRARAADAHPDTPPRSNVAAIVPDAGPRLLPLIARTAMAIAAVVLASFRPTRANGSATPKPTIVLVHGAWVDGSSWADISGRLQDSGYDVRVPPNNLRGPQSDAQHLAAYLDTIPGPIVLVGHAYGGVVITNAAAGNDQVRGLVYVDALIPAEGDTVATMTRSPSVLAQDATDVYDFVSDPKAPSGTVDVYVRPSVFAEGFTNEGFSRRNIRVLAASQRPLSSRAFEEPSGGPAWESIPTWAVIGEVDRVIPPVDQLAMAKRAGSIVVRIDAPHLSMLTDARAVTDVIVRAARSHR